MNLFNPSVRLINKKRIGSKVPRIYDTPKTPLERLKEIYPNNGSILELERLKNQLNLFELLEKIEEKNKQDNRVKG